VLCCVALCSNPLNPFDVLVAHFSDKLFNECIFGFFATGHFDFSSPGVSVKHFNAKAPASNDFFGLNYYSHYLVKAQLNPKQPFVLAHNTRDVMVCGCRVLLRPHLSVYHFLSHVLLQTDMPYPIYAEGLYRALKRCAQLKVPIYITENGLADAVDDRRALFIRRYLYAVSRAISEGVDVRGYFYWSLMVMPSHF
jgi:beta-glucosidase